MPLDVLGCTRATLKGSACFPCPIGPGNPLNPLRGRDWSLQLFSMNQEFPVSASHKLALITSLPFVHTARRYYRLSILVRTSDCPDLWLTPISERKDVQTVVLRGSKSRNKVSVGEPAEGSLTVDFLLVRKVYYKPRVGSKACLCCCLRGRACLPYSATQCRAMSEFQQFPLLSCGLCLQVQCPHDSVRG